MRPILSLALSACLAAASGIAASPARAEGPVLNLQRLGLTAREQRLIGSDRTRALQRFYGMALGISPDGVVTRDLFKMRDEVRRAQSRGRMLGTYLGYDLNGDQKITRQEFEVQLKVLTRYQLTPMLILRDTGDTNGDGVIDLPEMVRAANGVRSSSLLNYVNRNNDILMKMDVNGDGKVTLTEIEQVVTAVTQKRADEGQDAPIGQPKVVTPPTKL